MTDDQKKKLHPISAEKMLELDEHLYFNSSISLDRRDSASSMVDSSLAKWRRIRLLISSLKKLEPGTVVFQSDAVLTIQEVLALLSIV